MADAACILFAYDEHGVDVAAVESLNDDYLTFLALEGLQIGTSLSADIRNIKGLNPGKGPVYRLTFRYDNNEQVIIDCSPLARCCHSSVRAEAEVLRNVATKVAHTLSRRFLKEKVYPSFLRPVA